MSSACGVSTAAKSTASLLQRNIAGAASSAARPARRLPSVSKASKSTLAAVPVSDRVCPCCYGAVHKNTASRVAQHLQPFFRSFSSTASSTASSGAKGGASVVQLIKDDHRSVEADYARYESTKDPAERTRIAQLVIKKISQHGAQEEMSIYPWMKQHSPKTAHMVDHGIKEHARLKQDLALLDGMKSTDPLFDKTMKRVWEDLSHHIKEEESDILPTLEKIASASDLSSLGAKFLDLKSIAPTRPHPMAPTGGGAATKMANAGAAAMDNLRDAVQGRPKA